MAAFFFFDASALAKRYLPESGTPLVNHLFTNAPPDSMGCLLIGTLEVASVMVRRRNGGVISLTQFQQAVTNFRAEVLDHASFQKFAFDKSLVTSAFALLEKHGLNGTDSLVLAAALLESGQRKPTGEEVIVVASDQRLTKAVKSEGLQYFDPESQSQAELDALLAN